VVKVKPQAPSAIDLRGAAEWLALYASEDNLDIAQSFANVIAFLELTAQSKENRSILAEAKKQFAKANGIPVSQVRIKKEAQIIREGLALIPDVVNN
jgi:hypothetical protein